MERIRVNFVLVETAQQQKAVRAFKGHKLQNLLAETCLICLFEQASSSFSGSHNLAPL